MARDLLRSPEPTSAFSYAKAFFLTCLHVYPFLVIVQTYSNLQASEFKLCTSASPCVYFRIIATEGVKSTHFRFIEFPGAGVQTTQCENDDIRKTIINSMKGSISLYGYLVCIFGWGILKFTHDILMLMGFPQETTLRIGKYSVDFQWIATSFGFSCGMGAVEVFASHKNKDCLYRLSSFEALLSFATPVLLLYLSAAKSRAVALAGLYGDYLYYVAYDIPFYLVRHSPDWNQGSLLLPVVAGSNELMAPDPPLPRREFYQKNSIWMPIRQVFGICTRTPVVLAMIPIIPRFFDVVRSKLGDPDFNTWWIRGPLIFSSLLPGLLGLADAVVRVRTVITAFIPLAHRLNFSIIICIGLACSFQLAPPIGFLLGHETLPAATVESCMREGVAGATIFGLLVFARFGLWNEAFKGEDMELLYFARAGNHIHMYTHGSHEKSTTAFTLFKQVRGVGVWLKDPNEVLTFSKQRPDFARTHFRTEVKMAEEILAEMPSYDQEKDYVAWQQRLYAASEQQQNLSDDSTRYRTLRSDE